MPSLDLRPRSFLPYLFASMILFSATASVAGGRHGGPPPGHAHRHGVREASRGNHHQRGSHRVRYVVVREPRCVVMRPASSEWFTWRRARFVVVRPIPVWVAPTARDGLAARIGIHDGRLSLDLAFSSGTPAYGCGFCEQRFRRYESWERHTHRCDDAPAQRVICERWSDDELELYRAQARAQWESEYREEWGG